MSRCPGHSRGALRVPPPNSFPDPTNHPTQQAAGRDQEGLRDPPVSGRSWKAWQKPPPAPAAPAGLAGPRRLRRAGQRGWGGARVAPGRRGLGRAASPSSPSLHLYWQSPSSPPRRSRAALRYTSILCTPLRMVLSVIRQSGVCGASWHRAGRGPGRAQASSSSSSRARAMPTGAPPAAR